MARDDDGKKHKSSKPKLMSESGQTDEERRRIRRQQRALNKDIEESGQEIEDVSKTAFDDKRKENNTIFERVFYAREAALDGENLKLIASKASKQANKLVAVPQYDIEKVIKNLRHKASTDDMMGFDWRKLGVAAGVCFNAVPATTVMLGPLGKEHVQKAAAKKRKVRVEEEAEEENPDEILMQTKDKGGLSGMEDIIKNVNKKMNTTLKSRVAVAKAKKKSRPNDTTCSIVKLVANPKSFTQTAENILALSFMVKNGKSEIKNDAKNELPTARLIEPGTQTPLAKQSVLALNMKMWRELCEAYEVKEGDGVPLRSTGKKKKKKS